MILNPDNLTFTYHTDAISFCRIIHRPTGIVVSESGSDKQALTDKLVEKLLKKLSGYNLEKKAIIVEHKKLKRVNDRSIYKSCCPICQDGFLMMIRDPKTLKLLNEDRCLLCGQAVFYSDISYLE